MNTNKHEWGVMGMVLFCLLLMGGSAFAKSAELNLFPYVKHLAVEDDSDHALGLFELDSDIFERAADDFANLRVVDDAGIEVPFLVRSQTGTMSVASNQVAGFSVNENGNHTVVEFSARREPVVGFVIYAAAENFSRSIVIEGKRDANDVFRERVRGKYSHITAGGMQNDGRRIQLRSPARCSEWRITIDNKDNPALEIVGVTLIEKVHEGVFLNTHPGAYRLFYGGDRAKMPRYDIDAIRKMDRSQAVIYRLSEDLENSEYNSKWHLRIGGRVVLTIAILLMVAALGWGIVVASKEI